VAKLALNPPGMHPTPGYSHVVRRGNILVTAGQVPLDAEGNLVGRGDIRAQAEQVFANLRAVLAAAGASLEDVVKITTYATSRDYRLPIREIRNRLFPADPPGSTFVIVQGLSDPDWLLEVEAIAIVEEGSSANCAKERE
jgi:enamine deaminase RidA (YjgF/YER057c/UK114 family)